MNVSIYSGPFRADLTHSLAMRFEYINQHARVRRWEEEVDQLEVEMCNGVRHFDNRANWWLDQVGSRRTQVRSDIQSGLDAYARRQAGMVSMSRTA